MQEIFKTIGRLANSDATVLIEGESGTGRELIARAIHVHSPRWSGPFVALNCSAIPRDLLEASSSATSAARSLARASAASAASRPPAAARSSSTRSATCRSSCR